MVWQKIKKTIKSLFDQPKKDGDIFIGNIKKEHIKALKETISLKIPRVDANRLGIYQIKIYVLEYLGYLKPNSYKLYKNKSILKKELWTGKYDINSVQDFLKNRKVQEMCFEMILKIYYKKLIKLEIPLNTMPPEEVLGFLLISYFVYPLCVFYFYKNLSMNKNDYKKCIYYRNLAKSIILKCS